MSSFMIEELNHRLGWLRDEQARLNTSFENRIKELETENQEVRNRLTVLTRLLISRQIASAEEIATAVATMRRPLPMASEVASGATESSELPIKPESGLEPDKTWYQDH